VSRLLSVAFGEGRRRSRISLKSLVPAVAPLLAATASYGTGYILRRADCAPIMSLSCLVDVAVVFDATNWPASFIDER
jgi:hypothetical protein